MPDIVVRHIDEALAERIKELALARKWSLNDVILHALRHGLGMASCDPFSGREVEFGRQMGTGLSAGEDRAFSEALAALADVPAGQFARKPEDGPQR
ncbi:hypothetical protein B1806_06135 [Metallibacterium scheffleri]|uniref:Uncharacterized protein n=1 Tax=Metallibacterium scheffleri TaxID=993689 RepID=A0A4S3KPL2_9GAMM|nr:hypothetical protein B1806_06135 [Metallibacterium scheffleri]